MQVSPARLVAGWGSTDSMRRARVREVVATSGNATDAVDVAHDVGEVAILEGASETEGEAV